MNCLILGGNGFIGFSISLELANLGHNVTIVDRHIPGSELHSNIRFVTCSLQDFHLYEDYLDRCDVLVHSFSSSFPANTTDVCLHEASIDLVTTIRILDRLSKFKNKKIIFLSSGGVIYGDSTSTSMLETFHASPINSYGIMKRTIEDYICLYNKIHNLPSAIFRISNPYGENQLKRKSHGAVSVFLNKTLNNEIINIWGDGNITRDYIYISDVVYFIIKSSFIETPEVIYNLGTGVGTTLNKLITHISNLGLSPKVEYSTHRNIDVDYNVLNTQRLYNRFGSHEFLSLDDGLLRLYHHHKKLK